MAAALRTAAECMDPPALLERLLPYAAHKNPKVRTLVAKAGCSNLLDDLLMEVAAAALEHGRRATAPLPARAMACCLLRPRAGQARLFKTSRCCMHACMP